MSEEEFPDEPNRGGEGERCYPNGTCEGGLACADDLCVVSVGGGGEGEGEGEGEDGGGGEGEGEGEPPGPAGPALEECPDGLDLPDGWVCVPPTGPDGFLAGSPEEESHRYADFEGHRRHRIARAYAVARYELTQRVWGDVAARSPDVPESVSVQTGCDECAASKFSFWEVLRLLNAWSALDGLSACYDLEDCGVDPGPGTYVCTSARWLGPDCEGYRLPTEAEWEHAARAGVSTAFTNGDLRDAEALAGGQCANHDALDRAAWCCGNAAGADGPSPVGDEASLPDVCNARGICDVLGNVAELTWSRYGPLGGAPDDPPLEDPPDVLTLDSVSSTVVRGGGYDDSAVWVRLAARKVWSLSASHPAVGFRPVRTLFVEGP